MALFKVHRSSGGRAIMFLSDQEIAGVDISLEIRGLPSYQHDGGMVLAGPLATDAAVDSAVDKLIQELEEIRAAAKRAIVDSSISG